MNDLPLISIVTPSLNQAGYLGATLQSVLNQDYPSIEYIVIDGASSDGSTDILRRYEARLAYWVSEPDHGQSEAINKGMRRARGQVLAYLNSDDCYLPGALRSVADFFNRRPDIGLAFGSCLVIGQQGEALGTMPRREFSLKRMI